MKTFITTLLISGCLCASAQTDTIPLRNKSKATYTLEDIGVKDNQYKFRGRYLVGSWQPNIKKELPGLAALFISGIAIGVNNTLIHHPNRFWRAHPNANRQFWDPNISWTNKYMNGDPNQGALFWGSTNIFAGITDGYHLTKSIHDVFLLSTFLIIPSEYCQAPRNRHCWLRLFARAALYGVVYKAGFYTTYSIAYPKRD